MRLGSARDSPGPINVVTDLQSRVMSRFGNTLGASDGREATGPRCASAGASGQLGHFGRLCMIGGPGRVTMRREGGLNPGGASRTQGCGNDARGCVVGA